MSRILRSMIYRLLHSKLFYVIFAALIVCEAVMFFFGDFNGLSSGTLKNHETYLVHNHQTETEEEMYVSYEEEDPLLINKLTQNVIGGIFDNVPGQTYKYTMSCYNVASVSTLLAIVMVMIFAADGILATVFFGEMFTDDAIRNMVTIKTRKEQIYLSALIVNAGVCTAMYLAVFAVLCACILIAGMYPLIYAPAFITAVLVGLLITVTLTSFYIFVLFIVQNPMLSFIFFAMLAAFTYMIFGSGTYPGAPFENSYAMDEKQMETFFKGGYLMLGDKEWYLPVDDFRIGRVYVPSEDLTIDFASDELNEHYPGTVKSMTARTFFRANIMYYPCEMMMWFIYPMYRDGLMTRYAAVSSGYMVLLFTAGCYIVRKRNLN
ncbi:MAG: ABC transporter permease [Saccharofermentans sp.]|nr:ABC transporter permease [Saccharofermentans sp.]